jgi:Tc5 transposase DNA-binding domain
MANSDADLDELAQKAANEIRSYRETGERVSVAAIARQYGVHKNRVHRRLKGIEGRTTRKPINYKLSAVQEAALLSYIRTLDEIGQSIRLDQVSYAANSILRQDHTEEGPAPTVGDHWPRRFLDRHPELRKAKQKPLELERKLAHDPAVISNWFERFQQLRDRYGVHNEDIWNFDETGFRVGVRRSQ